jgi:hypothetical protein
VGREVARAGEAVRGAVRAVEREEAILRVLGRLVRVRLLIQVPPIRILRRTVDRTLVPTLRLIVDQTPARITTDQTPGPSFLRPQAALWDRFLLLLREKPVVKEVAKAVAEAKEVAEAVAKAVAKGKARKEAERVLLALRCPMRALPIQIPLKQQTGPWDQFLHLRIE